MAFQIKDFASISASMVNWMRAVTTKVTDFSIGSVVRTMLEAVAAEIDELYMRMMIGLREAIPTAVYTSFSFDRVAAAPASGMVRFTAPSAVASPLLIPIGTSVRAPSGSILYRTSLEATIATGQTYVDVLVTADEPGIGGNVNAATLTEMAAPVSGVSGVTNQNAFTNGRDAESDDERKARFQAYILSLARGTKAALIYGARTANLKNSSGLITEFVAHASVVEPWLTDAAQPVGLVRVYVYGNEVQASSALVQRAQEVIDGYYDNGRPIAGWKAAGVRVDVFAATVKPVVVAGVVTVDPAYDGATVRAAIATGISAYINKLTVGETVLRSELVAIAKRDIPGVLNVTLSSPSSDVVCLVSEKAVPNTIALT